MKYTVSIEIALPRQDVVDLISDPSQMTKWLRGLVLHEAVNGVHGQLGTTSRVVFQMGKQRMEATETITRLEPADLHAIPRSVVVHYDREIVGGECGRPSETESSTLVRTQLCGRAKASSGSTDC